MEPRQLLMFPMKPVWVDDIVARAAVGTGTISIPKKEVDLPKESVSNADKERVDITGMSQH